MPGQEGCFLAQDAFERDRFVRMNATGGPVDVRQVGGVDPGALAQSGEGHWSPPGTVPPGRVRLVLRDVPPFAP